MMVAFIHKIELRIEWIWQIGAESIWPKNHAFTDGTLHSRPNGRSYHLLRLSSWLVTSDWGGGLVSYDAGTQLRSSVHHRCYGTHTPAFPSKEFFNPYGQEAAGGRSSRAQVKNIFYNFFSLPLGRDSPSKCTLYHRAVSKCTAPPLRHTRNSWSPGKAESTVSSTNTSLKPVSGKEV